MEKPLQASLVKVFFFYYKVVELLTSTKFKHIVHLSIETIDYLWHNALGKLQELEDICPLKKE